LLKCSIIFVVMVYTPIFCKIIVSITFCFYASFNAVALLILLPLSIYQQNPL